MGLCDTSHKQIKEIRCGHYNRYRRIKESIQFQHPFIAQTMKAKCPCTARSSYEKKWTTNTTLRRDSADTVKYSSTDLKES